MLLVKKVTLPKVKIRNLKDFTKIKIVIGFWEIMIRWIEYPHLPLLKSKLTKFFFWSKAKDIFARNLQELGKVRVCYFLIKVCLEETHKFFHQLIDIILKNKSYKVGYINLLYNFYFLEKSLNYYHDYQFIKYSNFSQYANQTCDASRTVICETWYLSI